MEEFQSRRLYRSRSNRMIGGVCAGWAEYLHLDPTLVRIAWLVLSIMNGAGVLLYLVCLAVMPKSPQEVVEQNKSADSEQWGLFIGVALVALGLWFLLRREIDWFPFHFPWHFWRSIRHFMWPALLIVVGLLLILRSGKPAESTVSTGEPLPFCRSRNVRMIAGVCGGIAEHLHIDVTLVRIAFVAVAILTGFWFVFLAYLIMATFIPEDAAR